MNFIIERQEKAAEVQERNAKQIEILLELQATDNAKIQAHDERIKENDERIARFERSYVAIAGLLQKHDGQLESLTDGLNSLTRIVERYVIARGNGSNGTS